MGATPWLYLVDYQPDVNAALQALRQREFEAGGTQTILDIQEISEERIPGTASPLEPLEPLNVFGTEMPTVDIVEDEDEVPGEIFDFIGSGQSVYIVLYKDGQPEKLLFVGYSYD